MITLLFGKNQFVINSKLSLLKADFAKLDPSNLNYLKLDGANLTRAIFDQAILALPFLAEKRLIVVENLLLESKDNDLKNYIADKLPNINKSRSTDVVFVEKGEPDKRTRLYKTLMKGAEVHEAVELTGAPLSKWVAEQFSRRQITAQPRVIDYFISQIGFDMQRLLSEIEKISLFLRSQKRSELEKSDVDELGCAEIDPNIFRFTEAISLRDVKAAAHLLHQFLSKGESEQKLLGMLAYQYRTLLIIKDSLQRGISAQQISRTAKLAPYVVTKNLGIARNAPMGALIRMYDQLRRTDSAIKSGEIAPEIAIDILVTTLAK